MNTNFADLVETIYSENKRRRLIALEGSYCANDVRPSLHKVPTIKLADDTRRRVEAIVRLRHRTEMVRLTKLREAYSAYFEQWQSTKKSPVPMVSPLLRGSSRSPPPATPLVPSESFVEHDRGLLGTAVSPLSSEGLVKPEPVSVGPGDSVSGVRCESALSEPVSAPGLKDEADGDENELENERLSRKKRTRSAKWDRNECAIRFTAPPRRLVRDYSKLTADPPLTLTASQKHRTAYLNINSLVRSEAVVQELKQQHCVETAWTTAESEVFMSQYKVHGKNFAAIASQIPTKSLPMVVAHYYRIKHSCQEFQPIRAEVKSRRQAEKEARYAAERKAIREETRARQQTLCQPHRLAQHVNLAEAIPTLFEGLDPETIQSLQMDLLLDLQNRPRTRHQAVAKL